MGKASDKNAILTNTVCPNCGSRIVFDPHCSADWYLTIHDLVLQKYCPNCGVMIPLVEAPDDFGGDPILSKRNRFISNKQKERVAVKVAGKFNLGMKEAKQVAKGLRNLQSETIFLEEFARKMNQKFSSVNLTREILTSIVSD